MARLLRRVVVSTEDLFQQALGSSSVQQRDRRRLRRAADPAPARQMAGWKGKPKFRTAQPAAVPLVPAPRQPPTGLDRTGRPRFSTCCADSRRSFAKLRHGVQPRKRSAGFGGGLDDERVRDRGERERPRDKAVSFRGEREGNSRRRGNR
jgi:hypothetical protein